jgi:hypothetical protein
MHSHLNAPLNRDPPPHPQTHTHRIKNVGVAMHEELEQQSLLLGDMGDHVDATQMRLRGLRKRIGEVLQATRSDRQLQMIFALSGILAVLVVTSFV